MASSARELKLIISASTEKMREAMAEAQASLHTTENAMRKMANAFDGSKFTAEANAAAEQVRKLEGVTALTTAEQQKLNRIMADAIEKYRVMGKVAPEEWHKLEAATRQSTEALAKQPGTMDQINGKVMALGAAIGTFLGNLAWSAVRKLGDELMVFAQRGMELPAVQASFERLSASAQVNSTEMLNAMRTGTRGLVSELDLMQSANKAMLLGLPVTTESIGTMAEAATKLGKAMGLSATKSIEDLITALGRSSPMILDNLGLTVKVSDANEAYASKLGKTVEQLTEAEKKTAFYEEAMRKAKEKTKELGDQTETLSEKLGRAWTAIGNVVTQQVANMNVGVGAALSSWQNLLKFLELANLYGAATAAKIMAQSQTQVTQLTKAQKDTVAANLAIGVSVSRIAAALKVNEVSIQAYIASTKEATGATGEQEASLGQLLERARQYTTKALAPLTQQQKEHAIALKDGNTELKDIARVLGVSEQAVQKYLDSVKKSRDENVKYNQELQKQVDILLGRQLAREVQRVAVEVKAAGGASKIASDQQEVLNKKLVDFHARGAKLPPELHKMWLEHERLHPSIGKVQTAFQQLTPILKALPAYNLDVTKTVTELQKEMAKTVVSAGEMAKALEKIPVPGARKGVSPAPGTEGVPDIAPSFASKFKQFLSQDFPKLVSDGIQAGNSTFKSAGVALAGFLVSQDGFKNRFGAELQGAIGGVIGALAQGASLKQALQQSAPQIGGAIVGSIGQSIGMAFGGPAGAAIGKAVGSAVGTLIGGVLGGKSNDTKKDRESAAKAMGFSSLSALYAHLNTLGKEGAALANQALNQIGRKDTAANQEWIKNVEALFEATKRGAEEAKRKTEELQASLVTMQDKLKDLQAKSKPTWQQMRDSAQSLGIDINKLGTAFQQQRLTEQATEIWNAWDTLRTGAGANLSDHIKAMSGKLNDFVKESLKFGTEIPGNMKPMFEEMARQGLLLDENGQRMEDLSRLSFGADVKSEWELIGDEIAKLTKEIKDLVDLLAGGLTGAVGAVGDSMAGLPGTIDVDVKPRLGRLRPSELAPEGAIGVGTSVVATEAKAAEAKVTEAVDKAAAAIKKTLPEAVEKASLVVAKGLPESFEKMRLAVEGSSGTAFDQMIKDFERAVAAAAGATSTDLPVAFEEMRIAAEAAAADAASSITDDITGALDVASQALKDADWNTYAAQSVDAGDDASQSVDGVASSAEAVSLMLQRTGWSSWADEGVTAAQAVERALRAAAGAVGTGSITVSGRRNAEYGGAMAEGGSGVVTRPTWFLAGEAGPERYNFTPINQTASSGGGGDQTIVVQLDGEVIVRKVVYGMPRYLKLIGAQ